MYCTTDMQSNVSSEAKALRQSHVCMCPMALNIHLFSNLKDILEFPTSYYAV